MSKDAKKGNKSGNSKPAKKGLVVNRRHNRTVSQGVAKSNPKWEDIGLGILKRKGAPNFVKVGPGGRLVPLNRHQIRFGLNAIEAQKREAEALKLALLGDQAAE